MDTSEPTIAVMSVIEEVSAPTASIKVLKYCRPAFRICLGCTKVVRRGSRRGQRRKSSAQSKECAAE